MYVYYFLITNDTLYSDVGILGKKVICKVHMKVDSLK